MSKPEIHTFGIAKYVYASAYDQLEAEVERVRDELREDAQRRFLHSHNVAFLRGMKYAVAQLDALLTKNGGAANDAQPLYGLEVSRDEKRKGG